MAVNKKNINVPVGEIHREGIVGHDCKRENAPGVVICHPHPQFGGSMDNNVVGALFDEFVNHGYVALAFNFRGVGQSGGYYEDGQGEIEDVLGAVGWLNRFSKTKGHGIGLLGYSFGAWVGLQAAVREPRIQCAGAVAPPSGMFSFNFLNQYSGPLFIVSGDQDSFCPVDSREELLARLSGHKDWNLLAGGDHFFFNREQETARYLCNHFMKHLPPSA